MYLLHSRFLIPSGVSVLCCILLFSTASANALQVATTVTLEDAGIIQEGSVVISSDDNQTYQLSQTSDALDVFGVTAARPALVFSTGVDQIPVVAEGITLIQVDNSGGVIERGDLLVTSSVAGVARRAGELDENVFAIAMEEYVETQGESIGLIHAEIGEDRAQAALTARLQSAQQSEEDEGKSSFSLMRAVVAAVLAVGALFFVLHSFRSTIAQGVVSVGRNPKARSSIVTLAFGNIIFALILFALVVFIAVAILVLPV